MQSKLVLDIPHGGEQVPPELEPHLAITPQILRTNMDTGSRQLYAALPDIDKEKVCFFEYSPTLIDVNRSLEAYPGVFKSHTSDGYAIYQSSTDLPHALRNVLVDRYVHPYLDKLKARVAQPETRLVMLCHTMQATAPKNKTFAGRSRPLITLANGGDHNGVPKQEFQLTQPLMELMRDHLHKGLQELDLKDTIYREPSIAFNTPYRAENSIARLGKDVLKGKQAFLIKVNRSLLTLPDGSLHEQNIKLLRSLLSEALKSVLRQL